jgi:membrane-associated phospholipid phosphatase
MENAMSLTVTSTNTNVGSSAAAAAPQNLNKESKIHDAGSRADDHYAAKFSPIRTFLRNQVLLPIIAAETPVLSRLQARVRHPWLDKYFEKTSNLGTHTAYVLMLPMFFWYGNPELGRLLTFCLAFGVYFTNVLKDYFCLPRPRSPPVVRLTTKGTTHSLEYGFPSTHTANSFSIYIVFVRELNIMFEGNYNGYYWALQALNLLYIITLVFGRIYCGMHGFLDLLGGTAIGATVFLMRVRFAAFFDKLLLDSASHAVMWTLPFVLALLFVHPVPVEQCPCYLDGVAFLAVIAGEWIGEWYFLQQHEGEAIAYEYRGLLHVLLRFIMGSFLVLGFRAFAKTLLKSTLFKRAATVTSEKAKLDFFVYSGVGVVTVNLVGIIFELTGL